MFRAWAFIGVFVLACTGAHVAALADDRGDRLSQNAVGILAGEPEWLSRVQNLALRLDHQDNIRILPISGSGSIQALSDLAYLQGVDAALIAADTLTYAVAQGLIPAEKAKLAYVAQLSQLPVVLVARKEFKSLTSLAGRKISTGPAQSASFATGELLFGTFGIPFTRVAASGEAAVLALKKGQVDAALLLGTEALRIGLDKKRYHVLNLPLPAALKTQYAAIQLSSEQLDGMAAVESISTTLTLAVFNWPKNSPRNTKLKRLAKLLFAESNPAIAADIAGWQRHSAAAQVLQDINKSN